MGIFVYIVAMVESDHDLLVRMSTKVDLIYTLLSNHLEHHFWYNITLLGALTTLTTGAVMYVMKTRKLQLIEQEIVKEGE